MDLNLLDLQLLKHFMSLLVLQIHGLRHEYNLFLALFRDQSSIQHECVLTIQWLISGVEEAAGVLQTLNGGSSSLEEQNANMFFIILHFDEESLVEKDLVQFALFKSRFGYFDWHVIICEWELSSICIWIDGTWNIKESSVKQQISTLSFLEIVYCTVHPTNHWAVQFLIVKDVVSEGVENNLQWSFDHDQVWIHKLKVRLLIDFKLAVNNLSGAVLVEERVFDLVFLKMRAEDQLARSVIVWSLASVQVVRLVIKFLSLHIKDNATKKGRLFIDS